MTTALVCVLLTAVAVCAAPFSQQEDDRKETRTSLEVLAERFRQIYSRPVSPISTSCRSSRMCAPIPSTQIPLLDSFISRCKDVMQCFKTACGDSIPGCGSLPEECNDAMECFKNDFGDCPELQTEDAAKALLHPECFDKLLEDLGTNWRGK